MNEASGLDTSLRRAVERNRLCDQFEEQLREGLAPRIEAFLAGVPAPEREALLAELLRAELLEADLAGVPRSREELRAEYGGRFPDHLSVIDEVLVARDEQRQAATEDRRGPTGAGREVRPRFRILRVFGEGAHGILYLALDEELEREVLVKQLQAPLADDPGMRKRFAFEAKLLGRLEHPGIVPVYSASRRSGGQPYFVTRRIRGEDLGQAIDRLHAVGPRSRSWAEGHQPELRRLLRRFLTVCDTVAYAHSLGVIHRDLKPDHVLLGEFGETVVIDWGLAKPLGGEASVPGAAAPGSWDRGDATLRNTEVGTPVYASPEQLGGDLDRVGPASDVYGLGATLYELLTGRPPFDPAQSLESIREAVLAGRFPAPREARREVPRALDAICRKAMAREPADRYGSVLALAADLEHWLAGEPVSAHCDPWPVRLLGWSRRHRLRTGVVLTAVVLAGVGLGVWTIQHALARARVGTVARQIEAAALHQVPALVDPLRSEADDARTWLRARLHTAAPAAAQRLSLALAGLGEPRALVQRLRAEPEFRRHLADALLDGEGNRRSGDSVRLQTLVRDAGPELIDALLAQQSRVACQETGVDDWDLARQILLESCPDERVDVLVRCLADSSDSEFPEILRRLERRADLAREALHAQLDIQQDFRPFQPGDPAWSEPGAAAVAAIEAATGLVDPRFLLGLRLPLTDLAPLCQSLRGTGFRPMRVRPYPTARGDVHVAALWTRDDARHAFESRATAEALLRADATHRAAGLQPVDVAIYPDPTTGTVRYAAVWAEPDTPHQRFWRERVQTRIQAAWLGDPRPESHLVIGLDLDTARRDEPNRYPDRWRASTVQALTRPDGSQLLAQVREEDPGFDRSFTFTLGPASELADAQAHGLFQQDVGLDAGSSPSSLAATWIEPGWFASTLLRDGNPSEHLARGRELARQGHRPHSISVRARPDGTLEAASLWRQGRPHPMRASSDARAARLIMALDRLGDPDALTAGLRQVPDPTLRTAMVERLGRIGPPFDAIWNRLSTEPDVSSRRALVLALGGYPAPPASHPVVDHMLRLAQDEPDAGLRAAAWWLLGRWGRTDERDHLLDNQPRGEPADAAARDWYVNAEGQVLTIVRGPASFVMGEPMWDLADERFGLPHRVRIDRDFAIGATEVTAAQFERFREDRTARRGEPAPPTQPTRFGPHPDGPALEVSFLDAARYCNWLSERAGLPPDQWCFEEDSDGTLRLAPDSLARTGYRLPTEAEWEYACRAGSSTARPFGRSEGETLIPQYAWYVDGARNQAWLVAQLRPNDFGLFDMLGNAHEWCLDPKAAYCLGDCQSERLDAGSAEPLTREGSRMMRGGWFHQPANALTSAHRSWSWAAQAHHESGFRVARTLRVIPAPPEAAAPG